MVNKKNLTVSNRRDMAESWYKSWKRDNGIPEDSKALPPIDATPTWARPYLFPRAKASPNDGMKIAKNKTKKKSYG